MDEDEQYQYHLVTESDILLEDEYGGIQNEAYSQYNPAMHAFPNPTDHENA